MSAVNIATRRVIPGLPREMFSSRKRWITLIPVLAALGGFLFGYDTGVVGGAAPHIRLRQLIGPRLRMLLLVDVGMAMF